GPRKSWTRREGGPHPVAALRRTAAARAIARSLVNRPSILLADEPTGNLDSRTSVEIMQVFQELNEKESLTIILVTHEPDIADYAKRIITFRDGRIVKDQLVTQRRVASMVLAGMPPLED